MPLPKWILDIESTELRRQALDAQANYEKVKLEAEFRTAEKTKRDALKAAKDLLDSARSAAKKAVDEIRRKALQESRKGSPR